MNTNDVYAITPDEYGWRTLPNGRRVRLGKNVEIKSSAWSRVGYGATVGNGATVGDGAKVGDWATVGNGATVGDGATVGNGATVGDGARVGNGATVGDGARVGDRATVGDGIEIVSSKDIITIDFLGSRSDTLTAILNQKEIIISTGCFTGTLSEFKIAVFRKHGDNEFAKEYFATCDYVEALKKARFSK